MSVQQVREIRIVAYRFDWVREYAEVETRLRQALGDLALRIDHIGSTAVPELAAKDIIDVQITVRELGAGIQPAFERTGYVRLPHTQDHRPAMAGGSDRDWEKQMYRSAPGGRQVNVHVRRAGSANGRYALLFRDYLRAHPLAAASYARAKQALAQHGSTDWDLYYDVKDPICDIILAGAEQWAAISGWRIEQY